MAVISSVARLLLMPAGYYYYYAVVRHEHFYHGFPTSYWARAIKRWDPRASRTPSSFPYIDTVLTYFGFLGWPAILKANPDSDALPTLLDLAISGDPEVQSPAVWTLATAYGYLPSWGKGVGRKYGSQVALASCSQFGTAGYDLMLVDENGRLLDSVSCSVLQTMDFGQYHLDMPARSEHDGADIIVRDKPEELVLGSGEYQVYHGGGAPTFNLWESRPPEITARELKEKGLCRVRICDRRFEVVWPPLAGKPSE